MGAHARIALLGNSCSSWGGRSVLHNPRRTPQLCSTPAQPPWGHDTLPGWGAAARPHPRGGAGGTLSATLSASLSTAGPGTVGVGWGGGKRYGGGQVRAIPPLLGLCISASGSFKAAFKHVCCLLERSLGGQSCAAANGCPSLCGEVVKYTLCFVKHEAILK